MISLRGSSVQAPVLWLRAPACDAQARRAGSEPQAALPSKSAKRSIREEKRSIRRRGRPSWAIGTRAPLATRMAGAGWFLPPPSARVGLWRCAMQENSAASFAEEGAASDLEKVEDSDHAPLPCLKARLCRAGHRPDGRRDRERKTARPRHESGHRPAARARFRS